MLLSDYEVCHIESSYRLLKKIHLDYQSKITKDDETLLEKISVDNELDKRVTHDIDGKIFENRF